MQNCSIKVKVCKTSAKSLKQWILLFHILESNSKNVQSFFNKKDKWGEKRKRSIFEMKKKTQSSIPFSASEREREIEKREKIKVKNKIKTKKERKNR